MNTTEIENKNKLIELLSKITTERLNNENNLFSTDFTVTLAIILNNIKNTIKEYKDEQYKQSILESIGYISCWDYQLIQLGDDLQKDTINQFMEAWKIWVKTLGEKIDIQSKHWFCIDDDKDNIVKIYTQKFNTALAQELNNWLEQEVKGKILNNSIDILDTQIESVREDIKDLLIQFNTQVSDNFKQQIQIHLNGKSIDMNISKSNIEADDGDGVGFGFGLGGAGVIAGGLVFAGIGLIPIALAALGGGLGIGALFGETNEAKVKKIVLEKGFENFNNSVKEVVDKISLEITAIFDNRVKLFGETTKEAILILENIIEEQENINKQSQTIEQIERDIDLLLTRLIK